MSQVIVVAFDSEDDAQNALKTLRGLERGGAVKFEDTAIVVHHANGKFAVKNEVSGTTETGAAVGAVLGGLLFILFPLVGIALGAVAGAGVGAAIGHGVDRKFVKDVEAQLAPGKSALFLVIKDTVGDTAIAALRSYQGEVIQTTLDPETEESLRQAMS